MKRDGKVNSLFDGVDRGNRGKWQRGCGQNQKPWPNKEKKKSHPPQQRESYML